MPRERGWTVRSLRGAHCARALPSGGSFFHFLTRGRVIFFMMKLVVPGREDPPARFQPTVLMRQKKAGWDGAGHGAARGGRAELGGVQEAISSLFPKLSWSAPRGEPWIAMHSSLKCKTLSDIFLLFRSSDFITFDFIQPFIHYTGDSPDACREYELVL